MIEYLRRFTGKGAALPPKSWCDMVGNVLRTIIVEVWDKTYCEVDRTNRNGEKWVIRIPAQVLSVKGTKTLYKVVVLREWKDVGGTLTMTAAGSEGTDPADLYPTWDYVRWTEP